MTNQTKHTAGPWSIHTYNERCVNTGNGTKIIADCGIGELPYEHMIYNARLISAAPELLEALKSVSKCNRTEGLPVDVVIKMMEAISKAEGK